MRQTEKSKCPIHGCNLTHKKYFKAYCKKCVKEYFEKLMKM